MNKDIKQLTNRYRYLRSLYITIVLILTAYIPTHSQEAEPLYEEIIISVDVLNVGITEMSALIKEEEVYLPVADVFDFLKIKNEVSQGMDSVSGFFITEDARFVVDNPGKRILYQNKTYELTDEDLIKTETGLYMRLNLFSSIFSLDPKFNFRALVVHFTTKLELPVIREARLEFMRKNIGKLKGEIKADTTFPNKLPVFHFGMIDWSVISNQQIGGLSTTRYNLGLGGILAGGELNAFLNYTPSQPLEEKRQFYMWRHVDNTARIVKQVNIGKIPTFTHSSIFAPIVGFQLSNAPTSTRRSFGTYTLTNVTEPNWIVELYVNNVLVDYQKADANGVYTFNVPLVYGSSNVKLKFYGPFGEERSKQENVNVPYTFLPKNEFEYTLHGGVVEDDSLSKFSRLTTAYGLSNKVTIGSGVEYLTSVSSGNTMPFINTSARLAPSLLVAGEYIYSVRSRGSLSYRLPSSLQFEVKYTRFDKEQKAINTTALEERRVMFSLPFNKKTFSLFSLFTYTQTVLPTTRYDNLEWLVTGIVNHTGVHLNTYGIFAERGRPYIYSDFSLVFRLPRTFVFTPMAQYEYTRKELISVRTLLEKRVWTKGYLSFAFDQNFKSNYRSFGIQFRYEFKTLQLAASARATKTGITLLEAANGSLYHDGKTKTIGASATPNIGKGGALLLPFLDMNCNGIKDPGEQRVKGLKFTSTTGRILPESKDTTIRIMDLEPYTNCYLELNRFSFDNITWQIKNRIIKFTVEPNRFKPIEVPIAVVAEISGMVYLQKKNIQRGQGQVFVCIYKDDSLVTRVLSEPDGYFSFIGLAPGKYTASIDSAQLEKINMLATKPLSFNIITSRDGDLVEGLEFTLYPKNEELIKTIDNE